MSSIALVLVRHVAAFAAVGEAPRPGRCEVEFLNLPDDTPAILREDASPEGTLRVLSRTRDLATGSIRKDGAGRELFTIAVDGYVKLFEIKRLVDRIFPPNLAVTISVDLYGASKDHWETRGTPGRLSMLLARAWLRSKLAGRDQQRAVSVAIGSTGGSSEATIWGDLRSDTAAPALFGVEVPLAKARDPAVREHILRFLKANTTTGEVWAHAGELYDKVLPAETVASAERPSPTRLTRHPH